MPNPKTKTHLVLPAARENGAVTYCGRVLPPLWSFNRFSVDCKRCLWLAPQPEARVSTPEERAEDDRRHREAKAARWTETFAMPGDPSSVTVSGTRLPDGRIQVDQAETGSHPTPYQHEAPRPQAELTMAIWAEMDKLRRMVGCTNREIGYAMHLANELAILRGEPRRYIKSERAVSLTGAYRVTVNDRDPLVGQPEALIREILDSTKIAIEMPERLTCDHWGRELLADARTNLEEARSQVAYWEGRVAELEAKDSHDP